jgi:hypothetical protein
MASQSSVRPFGLEFLEEMTTDEVLLGCDGPCGDQPTGVTMGCQHSGAYDIMYPDPSFS